MTANFSSELVAGNVLHLYQVFGIFNIKTADHTCGITMYEM